MQAGDSVRGLGEGAGAVEPIRWGGEELEQESIELGVLGVGREEGVVATPTF